MAENLLNKDTVWNRIKMYIYLIVSLFILVIVLLFVLVIMNYHVIHLISKPLVL